MRENLKFLTDYFEMFLVARKRQIYWILLVFVSAVMLSLAVNTPVEPSKVGTTQRLPALLGTLMVVEIIS